MDKILTISIAAYNAEKDIPRCIDSLVDSGIIDKLDVIVVNDGSNDNTAVVAQGYADKYGGSVRVINKENGGHGSTINTSISCARGLYYKVLDSDDWVDSENLRKLVEFLENNDVDMVLNPHNEVSYSDHSDRKLCRPAGFEDRQGVVCDISELTGNEYINMHSLTFKTTVVKQMGSIIDENCFYVDTEYCIFPMLYVKTYAYLDYPVYQYLLGSQTQSMNMNNMIKRRDQNLKVARRLVEFYNDNAAGMDARIRSIVSLRIRYTVYTQYKIYINMPAKEALPEIKSFDSYLKKENSELYKGPEGRLMKLIRFNRNTGFVFYRMLAPVCRKFAK